MIGLKLLNGFREEGCGPGKEGQVPLQGPVQSSI